MINVEVLKRIVPTVIPTIAAWAEGMERHALVNGIPLDSQQWRDALHAGVQRPEKVRILFVDELPRPSPELTILAREIGININTTGGLALGYGIFLRNNLPDPRHRLIHELVHCTQFERLGEMRLYIKEYVRCCLDFGYANSPYELEADARTREILHNVSHDLMQCESGS